MIYCDSAYLLKFYIPEQGSAEIRHLLEGEDVASLALGQTEVVSAMHRKWREKLISADFFQGACAQFSLDIRSNLWTWFPVSSAVLDGARTLYQKMPGTLFLRASDALHLVCARENGFREIYSNDKHLLAAAKHFGLRGKNVINNSSPKK